jgi:hypothetical protein
MGGREARSQGYDGVEVEFEISSARPLRSPYVVTMTRFHPAGTKEGTVQNLVYAKSIDPIDSRPVKVHFVEGGLPFNFDLIDFQLHVYNQGVEVATNVSSKRVELTRDEAFEYVKMEYLGAHKGETLPAMAVMGICRQTCPHTSRTGVTPTRSTSGSRRTVWPLNPTPTRPARRGLATRT